MWCRQIDSKWAKYCATTKELCWPVYPPSQKKITAPSTFTLTPPQLNICLKMYTPVHMSSIVHQSWQQIPSIHLHLVTACPFPVKVCMADCAPFFVERYFKVFFFFNPCRYLSGSTICLKPKCDFQNVHFVKTAKWSINQLLYRAWLLGNHECRNVKTGEVRMSEWRASVVFYGSLAMKPNWVCPSPKQTATIRLTVSRLMRLATE